MCWSSCVTNLGLVKREKKEGQTSIFVPCTEQKKFVRNLLFPEGKYCKTFLSWSGSCLYGVLRSALILIHTGLSLLCAQLQLGNQKSGIVSNVSTWLWQHFLGYTNANYMLLGEGSWKNKQTHSKPHQNNNITVVLSYFSFESSWLRDNLGWQPWATKMHRLELPCLQTAGIRLVHVFLRSDTALQIQLSSPGSK